MGLPLIDIAAVPLLDTAVGLFGSLLDTTASTGASVVEVSITIVVIIYD